MLATMTTVPSASSSFYSSDRMASAVLRVSRETENIGERVPMSKKRVTWRFVFANSEQVHTVMLEHSRITAKKRVRLDGRRLFSSDQYKVGDWRYEFQVSKDHPTSFSVAIRDVKTTVVGERNLDSFYELFVDGLKWEDLPERELAGRRRNSSSVWSSELYARRVSDEARVLERLPENNNATDDHSDNASSTAQCRSWTFAFGVNGTIHKLELRDVDHGNDRGEFVVILDSRLLTRVDHDDIQEDFWEYEYYLSDQHTLLVVVTLEDEGKRYEFFIDGCPWKDLGETDFVLQPGWFPVYSRTRGTSYFRNEHTSVSQWERPIMSRNGVVIDVPRRASTQSLPLPFDHFDADGIRLSGTHPDTNQAQELQFELSAAYGKPTPHEEVNLLDFSEMSVHVSPKAVNQDAMAAFDPFAHLAKQQSQSQIKSQSQSQSQSQAQPVVDLLS
ncbi:hypothetical protein Poli38472_014085 [Pythium oligandrum]|uniref:WW domain-containing protein n=1 Tax=Pythium oligandrum TaxID=41045 RepID=A0A8K1CR06_PYTOL|nr:hypothetical protein Poli38472_014085 [Pythium oligandrum]|eukprot:TMW66773.1 hypothetical protein Poli38472_014085 [Pythium oligandrum]